MKIEAGYQGNSASDDRTDAAQQLALAVVEVLGHHGAVNVEEDAVERTRRLQVLNHRTDDPLIGIFGYVSRGSGRGPHQGHQRVAMTRQDLDPAGDRQVHARERLEEGLAALNPRPAAALQEFLVGGSERGEGIGLMMQPADRDPRHYSLPFRGGYRCFRPSMSSMIQSRPVSPSA